MKKFLGLFLCLILSFLLFVGCGKAITSVTVTSEKTEYFVGDQFTLTAKVEPQDVKDASVVWSSSDDQLATISSDGKVVCVKAGTVTFTAKAKADESKKGEITIVIKEKIVDIKVSKIEVSLSKESIFVGEESTITVTVSPLEATNKEYDIEVSDSSVVEVKDGKVKGLKEGTATITAKAKDGDVTGSATIEVKRVLVPEITLELPSVIYLGESIDLICISKDLTEDVVWDSSNKDVISINGTKATATSLGQALIIAKANGVEATALVKVEAKPEIVLSVSGPLYPESEATIAYLLTNLTGTPEFTTSNPEVFIINNDSVIAVGAGKATLTATIGEVTASIEIEVLPAPVITITGPETLEYGKQAQLQVTLEGIEGTVEWSSSNDEVASVDQTGLLTGIKLGVVSIYAEVEGFFGEIEIEIITPVFNVRFLGFDNVVLSEQKVPNRKAATAPDAPVVEGFKFIEWDVKFNDIQADLDVHAVYKKICNITYVLDGGSIPSDAPTTFVASFEVTLPVAKKDGFKFTGWTLTQNGDDKVLTIGANEEDDVVVYANYVVQQEEIYTVGPNETYTTLTSALAVADEGAKITVLPGEYTDNPEIKINNVTIIGPNAEISAKDGTRGDEAVFTGKITVANNVSGVSISGLKFTAPQAIVTSNVTNIKVLNNIFVGKVGGYAGIVQFANVKGLVMTGNHMTVDSTTNYAYGVYVSELAENITIDDNYFTNTASTSNNVFAIRVQLLAGDILLRRNLFFDFAGDYWTVYLGAGGACAAGTYIEYIENVIDGTGNSNKYACGVAIENLSSDSAYAFIIGNTFRYCKDTVLGIRGTSNSDSTTKATVKIMYNAFESVSTRMRVSFAKDNVTFAKNYKFQAYTNQGSPNIDAAQCTEGDFETIEAMKAEYEEFKKKPLVTFANIAYELDGGTVNGPTRYEVGKGTILPIPVKEFGTFLGWTLEPNSTNYITEIGKDAKGDFVLYAHWIVEKNFVITYDHDGGVSNELYAASATPLASIKVDNYNYNNGGFWSGKYATDVFLGESSCDPTATFSDRIYIGKDEVTGLYKIINILNSGASSWPKGAEYVLTISSSYSGYGQLHPVVLKLKNDMIVSFSKPLAQFTKDQPGLVNFYDQGPTSSVVTINCTSNDKLIVPSKLGYDFLGWYDQTGKKYDDMSDVQGDVSLKAKWQELSPVTDIAVEQMPTELTDGATFQINAHVVPNDAYFQDIYYSTSDKDIVSVTDSGLLTAVNPGTCTIKIRDYMNKVVKEYVIVVYPIKSLDVQFGDDYTGTLKINETVQLFAKAFGKNVGSETFTYKSSNESIVTVSATGLVSAKALGQATITISATGFESLDVSVVVSELNDQEKLDKVIKLITENNFATVDYGNLCLYNDGTQRNYVATYGSVNNFLFDPLVIDTTTYPKAEANPNCHKDRRAGIDTIEFVCVHDTATLTGTVESIASGMSSGETSIHYTVGNGKVMGVVPEKYIAYHAGDGTGTAFKWYATGVSATNNNPVFDLVKDGTNWYFTINGTKSNILAPITDGSKTITNPSKENLTYTGPVWKIENGEYYIGPTWVCFSQFIKGAISSKGGNNNSIGIEMCSNLSGDMYDTYQRTAKLVADILIRNGLDTTRVKQHNTFSGKNCPQTIRSGSYWEQFMKMVEINYILQKDFSDVEISMVSNNPEYVANNGRVIKAPQTTKTVSYTVTAKLGENTKSTTLYSVIPGSTTWVQWNGTYSSSLIWNNGYLAKREK